MSADGFLARWARRKAQAARGEPAPAEPVVPAPPVLESAVPVSAAETPGPAASEAPAAPAPTLEDVAALAPGDDVARFVARGVDESVKRAAVKKLFADPRFNVMDGLDIYIDDYSRPDPIPLAMLRQMNQSRFLGLFAAEEAAEAAAVQAAAATDEPGAASATPAELPAAARAAADPSAATEAVDPRRPTEPWAPSAGTAEPTTPAHEDPDLQLQPDDAAGRPGAATRAGLERA